MQGNTNAYDTVEHLKQILEALTHDLAPLFRDDSVQVSSWRRSLQAASESLQEQTLRVAVVGPVKSGKSTFINAMLGRDLLKRGAGIMTAFITRIRTSPEQKGWVELKSWKEINAELNDALSMVGLTRGSEAIARIDLRSEKDRLLLQELVQEVKQKSLSGRETFDPNVLLINSYLNGYSEINAHVGDEPVRLVFGAGELRQHQDFVSRESQSVYLRDMELQLPISWLGDMLEIGDCQGSDSPNPLHFAMLQEYLLGGHCILYLISSRVGLRQADLKLIEAIKILRMLSQTFFILNVDIDEHENLDGLERLEERVKEELQLLVPKARVYTFSALFQLLEAAETLDHLSLRQKRRMEGWRDEGAMIEMSRRGYEHFRKDVSNLVKSERSRVLYGGVVSHLQRVSRSIKDSVNTRQRLLSRDQEELKELAEQINSQQKSVTAALTTVEHTLNGLQSSLKEEVRSAVDSYFDIQYGPIVNETVFQIENYQTNGFQKIRVEETGKLLANLYHFYQDFRQMLSRHIIDKVNLRIVDFAKNEEERIEKKLMRAAAGYWELMDQALRQYQKTLTDSGLTLSLIAPETMPQPKRPTIKPPPFSAFVQSSEGLGRGSLLLKFGLRRGRQLFSGLKDKVLRRDAKGAEESTEEALREAISLVKKETQKELITSFRDYRQNFKFAYLFTFTEQYAQALIQVFKDFGDATIIDISHLQEAAYKRATSQEDTTEDLAIVEHRLKYTEERLGSLEESLRIPS